MRKVKRSKDNYLTPQNFWNLYSKKLNNASNSEIFNWYKCSEVGNKTKYTNFIINNIACDVIKNISPDAYWKVGKEYFNIDVLGYLSYYNEVIKKEHWILKLAYEHENENSWDDELCKLCNIHASLKVIASYHEFEIKDIIALLNERLNRLGRELVFRNICNWLFIFGPRKNYKNPYRAFTITENLEVVELVNKEEVIPDNW